MDIIEARAYVLQIKVLALRTPVLPTIMRPRAPKPTSLVVSYSYQHNSTSTFTQKGHAPSVTKRPRSISYIHFT
jgi:hypothetical protein